MSFMILWIGTLVCVLPFLPAVLEVFRKSDITPLAVSNQLLDDPRAEPGFLFWHLAQLLGLPDPSHLEQVNVKRPKHAEVELIFDGILEKSSDQIGRYLSPLHLQISAHSQHLSKIFSAASIDAKEVCAFNEIHAQKDLFLGPQNRVLWWASGRNVWISEGGRLPGKVQGSHSLTLAGSAEFHFLQAPLIQSPRAPEKKIAHHLRTKVARRIIREDFVIRAGDDLHETLIVKGNFAMEENAELYGDLKVHGEVLLALGAQVHGNVICLKNAKFAGGNGVSGSLLVENQLELGPESTVGSSERLVSVTAKTIYLRGNFKVHGRIRAWKSGRVLQNHA